MSTKERKCEFTISRTLMLRDHCKILIEQKFLTFPSLTILKNGGWLCSVLAGSEKSGPDGRIRSFYSQDKGETWTETQSPTAKDECDHPSSGYICCHVVELSTGRLLAIYIRTDRSDPKQPLFHPKTDGIQYSDVRITWSDNRGVTWEPPVSLKSAVKDILIPNKPLVRPDDTVVIPCEAWKEWDKGFQEKPAAYLLFLSDNLTGSQDAAVMARDALGETIYGDPRLACDGHGVLHALFWRYDLSTGVDRCNHYSSSSDDGKTWSEVVDTGIIGQIANPFVSGTESLFCISQDRFVTPGLRLTASIDLGKTWNTQDSKLVWEAPVVEVDKNPFQGYAGYSFGYSSVVMTGSSAGVVVFWTGTAKTTDICFLRFTIS